MSLNVEKGWMRTSLKVFLSFADDGIKRNFILDVFMSGKNSHPSLLSSLRCFSYNAWNIISQKYIFKMIFLPRMDFFYRVNQISLSSAHPSLLCLWCTFVLHLNDFLLNLWFKICKYVKCFKNFLSLSDFRVKIENFFMSDSS